MGCSVSAVSACTGCEDGVMNGGESGVDCGGSTSCPRCGEGNSCFVSTDCGVGLECSAFGTCIGEISVVVVLCYCESVTEILNGVFSQRPVLRARRSTLLRM